MIDYVKILFTGIDIKRLLDLTKLNFKVEVSEKTGEVSTKRVANYHFCKITVYDSGTVMFTGSIHKLWNSLNNVLAPNHKKWKIYKGYNGNQFTINDVIEVREHLQKLFNCTPQQLIFQNIEFGINTTPNFNPQLFLKWLLYHNGKPFEFRYKEHFAQAKHQRYVLKIYNKSNQYEMQEHTLRVELKIIKTEDIKHLGIKTFADINTTTLNKAKELILRRFGEVIYYDNTIRKDSLTKHQKQILERYSNPRYWLNNLTKQNRYKHKKKLRYYILKYSTNLHQKIRQEIERKGLPINRLSETPKGLLINRSSIGLKSNLKPPQKPPKKKCAITGVNLGLESKGSSYIKTRTLKHLKTNDKLQFELLVSMLMSNCRVKPKYEQSIISHLAKQIRNRFYNSNKVKQTGYKKKLSDDNQLKLVV